MITFWEKPPKEEGIRCVMRVKDEADRARLSILSIIDFSDETIFVDNGNTNKFPEIVRQLSDELSTWKTNTPETKSDDDKSYTSEVLEDLRAPGYVQ